MHRTLPEIFNKANLKSSTPPRSAPTQNWFILPRQSMQMALPDKHELLGQPVTPNGLPLAKIHYAAFDVHLLSIDTGFRLHISDQLLEKENGPLLDSLKRLGGKMIHLPSRHVDLPDRDRLALRFESFKAAA